MMNANKTLISLVAGMGFLIFGGLVLIGYGLYQKASDPSFKFFTEEDKDRDRDRDRDRDKDKDRNNDRPRSARVVVEDIPIFIPPGSVVVSSDSDDGRLILHLRDNAGIDRILVVDIAQGRVLRRFKISPAK